MFKHVKTDPEASALWRNEMEYFLSGYCRNIDASRRVLLETDEAGFEADCNYGCCPYESECIIAAAIREKLEEGT